MCIVNSSRNSIRIYSFITLVSMFICIFPFILSTQLEQTATDSTVDNFVLNLRSKYVDFSYITEFVVCFLFLIDIIVCKLITPKFYTNTEFVIEAAHVLSVLVPDLITFCLAIPGGDVRIYIYLSSQRILLLYGTMVSYLSLHGGHVWNGYAAYSGLSCLSFATVLRFYTIFASASLTTMLTTVSLVCYGLSLSIFLWLGYQWLLSFREVIKTSTLKTKGYRTGLIIIPMLLQVFFFSYIHFYSG